MKTIKTYIAILLLALISFIASAQQVQICHIPPGNPSNAHTILVDSHAVAAHLAHGDYLGACVGDDDGIADGDEDLDDDGDDDGDEDEDTVIVIVDEPQFEISVAPNPYSGFTTVQYTLPEDNGYMLIEVYDQQAHKIQTIVSAVQMAGTYSYQFSAVSLGYSPGYYMLVYNFWGTQTIYGTIVLLEL